MLHSLASYVCYLCVMNLIFKVWANVQGMLQWALVLLQTAARIPVSRVCLNSSVAACVSLHGAGAFSLTVHISSVGHPQDQLVQLLGPVT